MTQPQANVTSAERRAELKAKLLKELDGYVHHRLQCEYIPLLESDLAAARADADRLRVALVDAAQELERASDFAKHEGFTMRAKELALHARDARSALAGEG